MPYSNTPVFDISTRKYTQVINRKALAYLKEDRGKLHINEANRIVHLSKNVKKTGIDRCETIIDYKLNGIVGGLGYGRYYGTRYSLEVFQRDIRGALCAEDYMDIDVTNCHPSLILQMAKSVCHIEMPCLELFVADRDKFAQKIMATFNIAYKEVKDYLLSILYGGTVGNVASVPNEHETTIPFEFVQIKEEMHRFTSILMRLPEHQRLMEYLRKQKRPNIPGSFCSIVVQTEERKVLECMVEFLTRNKCAVDVLAYDGVQIRKNAAPIEQQLLRDAEDFIHEHSLYKIALAVKPFDVLHIDYEKKSANEEAYLEMKEKFELDHYYFAPSDAFCHVHEDGSVRMYALQHAIQVFNIPEWTLTVSGTETDPFFPRWKADNKRRIVDSIVNKMPDECNACEQSIFRGFAFQRLPEAKEQDAVQAFTDLVRCISGDKDDTYEYLLKSFARILQQPLTKSNVCTIISSETQGTGKDTLMLWLSLLIGTHHVSHYSSDATFWEKHDTLKEGAIVMYLEEAGSGENKKSSDALKARITEDRITINPKGMKSYTIPNIGNYFMTTNNVCPVKLELSDRRFVILNPTLRFFEKGKADPRFWTDFYEAMKSDSWIRTIGDFLLKVDITGFNPTDLPVTETRALLMDALAQQSSEELFLEQWEGQDQTGTQMYNSYCEFCRSENLRYKQSAIAFTMSLVILTKYFTTTIFRSAKRYSSVAA